MAKTSLGRAHRLLWIGFLTGPIAWAAHLQACYALVPLAQSTGRRTSLYVASALTLGLAVAGLIVSWMGLRELRDGARHPEVTERGTEFLGHAALGLGAFFVLVILAESVPPFLLGPYD